MNSGNGYLNFPLLAPAKMKEYILSGWQINADTMKNLRTLAGSAGIVNRLFP